MKQDTKVRVSQSEECGTKFDTNYFSSWIKVRSEPRFVPRSPSSTHQQRGLINAPLSPDRQTMLGEVIITRLFKCVCHF